MDRGDGFKLAFTMQWSYYIQLEGVWDRLDWGNFACNYGPRRIVRLNENETKVHVPSKTHTTSPRESVKPGKMRI